MSADHDRSHSAGGVVLGPTGQVLVVSQKNDSWSLPKGHIDAGETALQGARREIREESGIRELELICELGTYERTRIGLGGQGEDLRHTKRITLFLFKTTETRLCPEDADNPEARWVDLKDVETLLTHHKDKEFFRKMTSRIQEAVKA